jgi:NAD-dependent protein deacetylase/lipoamidase
MKYENIVILTGAGVSAESGLSTFRDSGGLWARHRIEDVATPEAFSRDPDRVQDFYNQRREKLKAVKPNPAHEALALLEAEHPGQVLIVTQNVDNLHEQAGSTNILHMHGELSKVRCLVCASVLDWQDEVTQQTRCPKCTAAPALRPHIVWFGEMPFHMEMIDEALVSADLFISIGTSGNVYPAAGFIAQIGDIGRARAIELNMEPSEGAALFDEARHGPAGEIVPKFVKEILEMNNG